MEFMIGKDMSPYGKSTSSSFKLLTSEDGLGCYGGRRFRLVFGFSIIFRNHRGLTEQLLCQACEHTQWQTSYRDWGHTSNRSIRKLRKPIVNGGLLGELA